MSNEQEEKILQSELVQVMRRMRKMRLNVLSKHVIYTEYHALEQINRYVKENPGSIGIYVSELAVRLNIVPSAASRLLGSMESKGLITRKVDAGSRRNTFVCLTPAGSEALTQAAMDMDIMKTQIIRRMGRDDITKLIELWTRLADIMEEELSSIVERRKKEGEEQP